MGEVVMAVLIYDEAEQLQNLQRLGGGGVSS